MWKISFKVYNYSSNLDILCRDIEDKHRSLAKEYIKVSRTVNSNSTIAHLSIIDHKDINLDNLKTSINAAIGYGASFEIKSKTKIKVG